MGGPGEPVRAERAANARAVARRAAAPLVLFLLALAGACAKPPPSFLILTIDTLRADHLSCAGNPRKATPHLDALAAEGFRFTRAYAARGQTSPSLATIFTGTYPVTHGTRDNGFPFPQELPNLFSVLGAHGWRTAAFCSQFLEAPFPGIQIWDHGIQDPSAFTRERTEQSAWDRRVTEQAVNFLENAGEKPFLLWVHFYGVHKPFPTVEPYNDAFRGTYDGPLRLEKQPNWRSDEEAVHRRIDAHTVRGEPLAPEDHAYVLALYDGGLLEVDEKVGTILEALDASGARNRTVVLVTGDHGEELGDHAAYYYHGASIRDSVLHVPLLARLPGRGGPRGTSDAVVELVDLAPTVLDLAGLGPLPEFEGGSLAPLLRDEGGPPDETAYFEWAGTIYAMREGQWKLVWNPERRHPQKPPYAGSDPPAGFPIDAVELFDLEADPRETTNLCAAMPRVTRAMVAKLEAWLDQPGHDREVRLDALDPGLQKMFRQLGYTGVGPVSVEAPGVPRCDPEDFR